MTRGPAWEAWLDAQAGTTFTSEEDAYAAGVADERARGMRRAARYAAEWHESDAIERDEAFRDFPHPAHAAEALACWKAHRKCVRIARGEPAFTTPRAFGREA